MSSVGHPQADNWLILFHVTACIACYISNKFVYSISLSTNSPDEGPLLETSRIEYFYLFQIVASENLSLGVVLLRCCLRWTSLVGENDVVV